MANITKLASLDRHTAAIRKPLRTRTQLAVMAKLIALLEEGEDNELIAALEEAQMEKELFLNGADQL